MFTSKKITKLLFGYFSKMKGNYKNDLNIVLHSKLLKYGEMIIKSENGIIFHILHNIEILQDEISNLKISNKILNEEITELKSKKQKRIKK